MCLRQNCATISYLSELKGDSFWTSSVFEFPSPYSEEEEVYGPYPEEEEVYGPYSTEAS